jgi:hypothetical protein
MVEWAAPSRRAGTWSPCGHGHHAGDGAPCAGPERCEPWGGFESARPKVSCPCLQTPLPVQQGPRCPHRLPAPGVSGVYPTSPPLQEVHRGWLASGGRARGRRSHCPGAHACGAGPCCCPAAPKPCTLPAAVYTVAPCCAGSPVTRHCLGTTRTPPAWPRPLLVCQGCPCPPLWNPTSCLWTWTRQRLGRTWVR